MDNLDMQSSQGPAKLLVKRTSGGGNKRGTPADRRATHNAVERARRESLNVRFLELAANLPATCTVRRPSKNLIVNKSIDFVRTALHNDAVLRLKLDEVMRQNQSLLQEVNQLRAERGLSPRPNTAMQQRTNSASTLQADFSTLTTANLANLSKDALTSAFRVPGLPQPLASIDFTRQVMEQNVSIDLHDVQHMFGNDGDEETLSNHASTDDISGAASDHSHSSPVRTTETGMPAMPVVINAQASSTPYHVQHLGQPQYSTLMQQPGAQGVYPTATNTESMPSYAHLAGINTQNITPSSFEYMSAMSPTTAAMFTNMVSSYSNGKQNGITAQSFGQEVPTYTPNRNANGGQYGQTSFFAMPA